MKRLAVYAVVIISLATAGAWLAAETPPEKAPEGKSTLPPGHPMLPQAGGLPPGHPPMGPAGGGMPGGHPPISSGAPSEPDPNAPPPDAKSTLVVQAVQGTPKGPAAKGDAVAVVLIRDDRPVKRLEAKLDDKGRAVLEDVPVGGGVQAFVTVKHGDVIYWAIGDTMHAGPPDHLVSVTVYETTEEPPTWFIRARHMFVRRTEEGLLVREVLAVENTADKAWIGRKGDDGKRVTVSLPLSPKAGRLTLGGGFQEGGAELLNGSFVSHAALKPGMVRLQFTYVIPVGDGKANLDIACPTDTDQLVLAVPEDGSKVSVKGLAPADAMAMGQMKVRMYKGDKVKAGTAVSAAFTDIPVPPPAMPPAMPPALPAK